MMAAITAFNKEPVSALNWAHDQNLQTESYQLYGGNRTFESAVLFYSEGKENIAYNSLGHILHLIEDMAVPAHTRQDTHADLSSLDFFSRLLGKELDRGEPYERWAENYTAKNSELNIADKLKNNYTPICDSLDECLIFSAKYSNYNFFSQDSIFDREYVSPKSNYVKNESDQNGKNIIRTYFSKDDYSLAKSKIKIDTGTIENISLDYPDIHQVYWDNLSQQAVLAGVEVVKYFQDQTEKVKNKEITIEKPQNPNLLALLNSVSVYGEVARTGKLLGLAWGDLQAKVKEAGEELVSSVNDFYNRIISFNPAKEFEPPTFSIEDTIFSEETIFSEKIEPPPGFLPNDNDEPNIELISDDIIRDTIKNVGGPIIDLVNQFGLQEDLDDILEKIDIIRSEIEKLRKNSEASATGGGDSQNNQQNNNNQDDNQQEDEGGDNNSVNNNSVAIGNSSVSGGNSSGGGSISIPVVYSKILISEIQISGLTDEKEEFVELFNPNNEEIILTDWYLQRKTETGSNYSTFVSNNLFSGKRIGAMGYFLIAREGSSFESFADIITENSLGDSGSSSTLVFKNPNREISDKLGFGAPQEYEASPAQKPEKGKSLGRKWVLNTEQDTDNNLADFEIQNLTPRARNVTYVAPVSSLTPMPPVPISPTPSIPIPTDTTAPQTSFNLNSIQTALNFTINFTIIDPTGVVSPSGIDSYIFRWKEGTGIWYEDVLVKVLEGPTLQYSASRIFEGEDEKTYYFQIKAKDIVGNESGWLPEMLAETKISIPKKILISEIQISGITDEKEEFVELYNPNLMDIDLTGWYIQKKTKTGASYSTFISSTLFEGKKINSKGYFLISREGSSFSAVTDITTSNSLGDFAADGGSSLIIKNSNREIADKVGWGQAQDFETAPALNLEKGKSLGRKWVLNTEQDTDNNLTDFEIQNSTPRAINITYIAPVSPLTPVPTPTDTIAPQTSFNINLIQTALNFTINFTIVDPTGVVSPSGIDNYIFRWKEGTGIWYEDVLVKVLEGPTLQYSANRIFEGEDEKTYYFQVKAKDVVGNESDWLPEMPAETKISGPKKILINEIQISGTIEEKEEFVELYNPNSIDIDLTGWYIQKKTKTGANYSSFASSTLFEGKNIKAKGYFLISREGSSFSNVADIVTSNSLGDFAVDGGSTLIIKNSAMEIIDKVGWGQSQDFETVPASNPPKGQSIQRKWDTVASQHQDTNDNSADFGIQAPNPKTSYPKVNIEDATKHPNDMGSGLPGTIQYFIKIKWQGISFGIANYDIQYRKNDTNWQDWLQTTVETEKVLQAPYSLLTDNIYHFRARATDQDGNTGNWKEVEVNLVNPVVINEVAYFGTNSSRDDQWIEFYNRSNSPVDLTGWKIVSGISGYNDLNVELKGIIPAKGYFILEKSDDSIIFDILANQFFTGTFGKAYFYLYDSNNRYIDQAHVPAGGWSGTDLLKEGNYYSIERISPYSFGLDPKNWRVNNGVIINGKDRDGGQIYGTPASANSIYQIYTSHYLGFVEDTVLKKELSPYLFWGPSVTVLKNFTLTIEPGTVIKFLDAGLTIDGSLRAIGTSAEKIVFTSILDDSDGRDTNGDADGSLPNPGNWFGINFTKNSSGSELENVVLRYAGDSSGAGFGTGIKVDRSSISLKNSVVEKNKNKALWLINSLSSIESSYFIDNNTANNPSANAMAIQIEGSAPIIKNCYFEKNGIGVNIDYWYDSENSLEVRSFPVVENNIFKENLMTVWIGRLSHPSFTGNQMTNNSLNAPVFWGPIEEDTILKSDTSYIFRTNLTIPIGVTLTIEPGAIIKFINAGLIIDGTLKALGTPDQKIVFTSFVDDEYGGDTNGDADASLPNPGNWFGIQFTKNSVNSELENIVVRYAGDFSGSSFGAGLRVDQSNVSLRNSVLENNANNGLWLINSSSIVDNIQLSGHIKPDYPKESKAVYIQGGKPEVKNSRFQDNYYGVYMNKWTDPDTGLDVNSEAELHLIPLDPLANAFTGSLKLDIFDASIIP
ncbi:MAG: lamin tail domain-containing protein [bacterium]|nr:lamin tail domain-containing protein [bacterium]